MDNPREWSDLPHVLHDAELHGVEWDRTLARVALTLKCLRREVDGTEIADPLVSLRLEDVEAILISHTPSERDLRPSAFRLARGIRPADLVAWPFGPVWWAVAGVNSAGDEEDARLGYATEWALGDQRLLRAAPCRLSLWLDRPEPFREGAAQLLIGAGGCSAWSGETPLDSETWRAQYAAWWTGWEAHWERKRAGEGADAPPADEDTAIPMAASAPPDRTYRPPTEPAFALEATDAPATLLAPVRAWFESAHRADWAARARVTRSLDLPLAEQARRAEADFFGGLVRWGYVREVDRWWSEPPHACVTVRGIEHVAPFEDVRAENVESVWTFSLRRRARGWVIHGCSQGWPPHGSAPARRPGPCPWLDAWRSGPVLAGPKRR